MSTIAAVLRTARTKSEASHVLTPEVALVLLDHIDAQNAALAELGRREVEARAILEYVRPAFPVLATMCRVKNLLGGQRKALEMLDELNGLLGIPEPIDALKDAAHDDGFQKAEAR